MTPHPLLRELLELEAQIANLRAALKKAEAQHRRVTQALKQRTKEIKKRRK